jgi:hypothetical protein
MCPCDAGLLAKAYAILSTATARAMPVHFAKTRDSFRLSFMQAVCPYESILAESTQNPDRMQ